ncbi:MAG TPA: phosphocholine cytidylyltransferase family protein [Natronosporangium sp.]
MIGLVLAAGAGRRLLPHTEHLPKTLLPVAEERTILDVILANLAAAGLTDVAVVVGHHADAVKVRVPELERRHGVRLRLVHNDRVDWNNAYSLWLARDQFADGALLVNGDTVHPVSVERTLLAGTGSGVRLAVDAVKTLTDEAMKVRLDGGDRVVRITKQLPVETAHGEYIGAALIDPGIAAPLAECLADTWRRDPGLYYEDGFQLLADRTGEVRAERIGTVDWVEVDDPTDLARARELVCRY